MSKVVVRVEDDLEEFHEYREMLSESAERSARENGYVLFSEFYVVPLNELDN